MASSTAAAEGPVLSLISKRLRTLRKKLNRIAQMQEFISQGKTLNKEQEEVFKSKPSVVAAIDELSKLRSPLSVSVEEEIRLAAAPPKVKEDQSSSVEDLLNLLYFSSMFDVKSQDDFSSLMLTKNHERESCLSYDYVTEEDTDMLSREDLDLISQLGGLLISRPVNSSLSHKHALELCVEHAKQWIANSDHRISSDANVTYAGLKAKLNKIMSLNYFTITPKIKAAVEMAAVARNYDSLQASEEDSMVFHAEGSDEQDQEEDAANSQLDKIFENLSSPAEEPQKHSSLQGEFGSETSTEVASHKELDEPPKEDQNHKIVEKKEQHFVPCRNYQNERGGGNGHRGHSNGRGGRGGGGAYQDGGYNQYYDQRGNYFQRSSQNRERGGRGGNHYQSYVPKAQASHVPAES